jgi:choline-sulfatase
MIRKRNWKYVHYVGERPQLFDLDSDPDEIDDRCQDPDCAAVIRELRGELDTICDPATVNARAFADQQARIARFGGLRGIESSVDIPFTPAPT